jgi:hypothetical protein
MDLLQHLGYPWNFFDWTTTLLSSSSSRVLLNGIAGDPIKHGRGLRQGDPLSMLLFVLAIDPLLRKSTNQGHIKKSHPFIPMMSLFLWPQIWMTSTS